MKILSRKEQDEILKRISACQIICNNYIGIKTRDEIEAGAKMTENLADIAAGAHDLGKYYTKTFMDSKGNPSEEAHYYGHENYGAYMFLLGQNHAVSTGDDECAKTDKREQKNNLYIASLINWHMRPHTAWKQSEKAKERDRKLIGEEMYQDIMILHEADLSAH